ncbi:hypothetical protein FB45DRAFT_1040223 [Roridomyces roridus]|uniref:Uncharacterized protein n=1 Tax=Roridomyces roridus TaxID=1738132 RepID=A0AAD7FA42_9AGAR|nr:hypothetical protein FB45DRAFT_1040223 [Roridomyces roridus]
MYAVQLLSIVLALSLAAANPLLTERQTCECESPTGCPGRCSGNYLCVDYCRLGMTVACSACGTTSLGCILNTDGTCFTVDE